MTAGFNPGSYPTILDVSSARDDARGVYAHEMFPQTMSLTLAGSAASHAARVFGRFVSTNYFAALRVPSVAGQIVGCDDGSTLRFICFRGSRAWPDH